MATPESHSQDAAAPATADRWSVVQWSQAITNQQPMRVIVSSLSQEVVEFERSMDTRDRQTYLKAKQELEKSLSDVLAAQAHRKGKIRKPWLQKVTDGWEKFCETANYYQSIFDVLNNQAPEYSTAVWGAIKILLLVSVNSSKLKSGVIDSLDRIGHQLGAMKVLVELHPTKKMVDAVTVVYADTMSFLSEALHYYSENRFAAAYKKLLKPWEIRFKQLVDKIEADVQRVQDLVQVGNTVSTYKILQDTGALVDGQNTLLDRQEVMLRAQIKDSEIHTKMLENVTASMRYLQRDAQETLFHQIEQQLNTFISTVLDKTLESERPQTPFNEIANESSATRIYLSHYLTPRSDFPAFLKGVFPLVDITEAGLAKGIERYSTTNDTSRYVTSYLAIQEVSIWIDRNHSALLFIEIFKDPNADSWSQHMCLEIVGASSPFEAVTCLHYLAAVQDESAPEILVQTLIYQLISWHKKVFSTRACRQHNITEQRFEHSASDILRLIDLFNDCLQVARPPMLYIIVDAFEHVSIPALETHLGTAKLESILDALTSLCQEDGILTKVLITSTSSQDRAYLETPFQTDSDLPRCKCIQTTRGTHPNSIQNIAVKPIVRLPSQQDVKVTEVKDAAALLELEDLGFDIAGSSEAPSLDMRPRKKGPDWLHEIDDTDAAVAYLEEFDDIPGQSEEYRDSLSDANHSMVLDNGSPLDRRRDYLGTEDKEKMKALQYGATSSTVPHDAFEAEREKEAWESDDSAFELLSGSHADKKGQKGQKEEFERGNRATSAERYLDSESD